MVKHLAAKKNHLIWIITGLVVVVLLVTVILQNRRINELNRELKKKSITYKFDHWLKERIILNVMELYDIKYYKKPLFFKCNPSANHDR